MLITGCSTSNESPTTAQQHAGLDTLIKQADVELASGKSEQSIALLNRAAKENPTSVLPWLKLANVWFNLTNYPSAILTANEVLQRDAENQEAKSILVVAGLRVAAGAITGLVQPNPVNSSARIEAENLTKALRVALGEKVLVPPTAAENTAPAQATSASTPIRRKYVAPAKATSNEVVTPKAPRTAAPAASSNSGGSDPFKSLK